MTATALATAPVTADDRYGQGRVRPLLAYDCGLPAPPRPAAGPGAHLATAEAAEVVDVVAAHCAVVMAGRRTPQQVVVSRTGRLLEWLARFPGASWEERWLASGADAAPRRWAEVAAEAGVGSQRAHAASAACALVLARVLRPSYSWLLNTSFFALFGWFPQVKDPDAFAELRALPAYPASTRLRCDAEAALIRVMVRTGKPLMALTGEDLLTYADLVATSGRHRREHLPGN